MIILYQSPNVSAMGLTKQTGTFYMTLKVLHWYSYKFYDNTWFYEMSDKGGYPIATHYGEGYAGTNNLKPSRI